MFKAVKNDVRLSSEVKTLLVWSTFASALCVVIAIGSIQHKSAEIAELPSFSVDSLKVEDKPEPEVSLANHFPYNDPIHDETEQDPFPFASEMMEISDRMDVETSLIYAITKAESSFRTQVKSEAGAYGLMQIVADRAGKDAWQRVLKEDGGPSHQHLKDPYTNLLIGSAYVKLLNEHYFDHIKDPALRQGIVLAAYNWGPSNVKRMLRKGFPRNMQELNWSLYKRAPRETYNYVRKVLRYKAQFEEKFEV